MVLLEKQIKNIYLGEYIPPEPADFWYSDDNYGFIDENGWLYPTTSGGGSGVILKTDKTFTDFHRRNPYLWR